VTPASPSEERFGRALAFLRGTLAACADSFVDIDGGWVARTPSLPHGWFVNQLRLPAPADAASLQAAAERELAGMAFRHVVVEGEASALGAPLRAAGWEVSRVVVMALAAPPDVEVAPAPAIAELGEREWAAAYRRWHLDDPRITPEEVDQVVAMGLREGRVRGDRRFGMMEPGDGGVAVAIASLRSDGRVAQVEDVWTAPEARGRGYARALVTHAVSLALGPGAAASADPGAAASPVVPGAAAAPVVPGAAAPVVPGAAAPVVPGAAPASAAEHELTFVVADDEDWPKELYARLGFEPVGRLWVFHRSA
jgi:GNAT superfamily N-acetyltransferase